MSLYTFRFSNCLVKFFYFCFVFSNILSCDGGEIIAENMCPPLDKKSDNKISLTRVNLYMDASGSMKGLMQANGPKDFRVQIPNFLANFKSRFPHSDIHFFIMESPKQIKEISFTAAKDELIADNKISKWADSTFIPEMLDSIRQRSKMDSGLVNILITDGIYSPNNKEQLAQSTRKIFEVFDTSFVTTIVSTKSTYHKASYIVQSPYYYFIMGKDEGVELIRSLLRTTYDDDYEIANYGETLLNPYYTLIPYFENTGGAEIDHCSSGDERYLVIKNLSGARNFWLGIDLGEAPNYVTADYVKANLEISRDGILMEISEVLDKRMFLKRIKSIEDKKVSEKCSHFIKFSLKEPPKNTELLVTLKKLSPAPWVSSYSHQVSESADTKRDATYGFDQIISGLERAYKAKNNEYFFSNLRLIVSKK